MTRFMLVLSTVALLAGTSWSWQPEPLPLPPRPTDGPSPMPPPPPGVVVESPIFIPNHFQFADAFKPLPGKYRVLVMHPCTCKPVEVCFNLPDRCAKYVKASKNEIEIRYGLCKYVKIRFYKDGDVSVRYGLCT